MSINTNINVEKINKDFKSWHDVILKALMNGWTVKLLFKLNQSNNEIVDFINFSKQLIETGRFLLYYYKSYDKDILGSEVAIIPGIGAFSCLFTNANFETDFAFYTENDIAINLLCDNFKVILLNSSKPLVKYYTLEESMAYNDSLAESEEAVGKRFLFKDNLSLLTIPNILFKKLLQKLPLTDEHRLQSLELHNRRIKSFLYNLKYYEYYDIYTLSSIQNIIKDKKLLFILSI